MSTEHIEMSYKGALVAGGATVHAFEEFGSYQGEWWALVTFEGETGWVKGSYGSCSGCDALQGEFGYDFGDTETYDSDAGGYRPKTAAEKADEAARFADFGRSYLVDMLRTQAEAEKDAARDLEWDSDAATMLAFIKTAAPAVQP